MAGSKLFVGGILTSTSEDSLRRHFEKYGRIADAVVMRERGFGFVTFEDPSAASAALADTPHSIDGMSVSVKESVAKGDGRGGGGGGGGGGDSRNSPTSGPTTDKIFVGGLPQDCADDKVRSYFSAYGTITDCVVMKDKDTGRSRGFGFVQYDNTESVEKVLQDYRDHKVEGKWIEVKRSIPRDQMPPTSAPNSSSRGGGGGSRGGDRGGGSDQQVALSQGYPGMPGACGGYPGYPGACGGYDPYSGYSAYGAYPGYPGYPAYGGYPGYPGYPGMPAGCGYPGMPGGGQPPPAGAYGAYGAYGPAYGAAYGAPPGAPGAPPPMSALPEPAREERRRSPSLSRSSSRSRSRSRSRRR